MVLPLSLFKYLLMTNKN